MGKYAYNIQLSLFDMEIYDDMNNESAGMDSTVDVMTENNKEETKEKIKEQNYLYLVNDLTGGSFEDEGDELELIDEADNYLADEEEFLEGDIEAMIGEIALEAEHEASLNLSEEEMQERINSADAHFKEISEGSNEDIMMRIHSGKLSAEDVEALENFIVEKNEALMRWVANRYSKAFLVDDSETFGVTWMGMRNAIKTYDPTYRTRDGKQVKFATYATRCVMREVMALHKKESTHYANTTSMETPTSFDKVGRPQKLEDTIADTKKRPDQDLDENMGRDVIWKMLYDLDPTSRYIMVMRFGLFGEEHKTEKDIAVYAGMSQANVSKKETAAKEVLCSKYSGMRDYLFSFFI